MAKSNNAKRRTTHNRVAQKNAAKRTQRSKATHEHLPKVGSPKDDAYIRRRRQADLVDFGQTRRGTRRVLAGVVAIFVLMALLGLLFLR